MNGIIAFAIRASGLGWLWDKFSGAKAHIAGAILCLDGAAKILIGTAGIIKALVACPALACAVELARNIGTNPDAATIGTGIAAFGAGLGIIGVRHAIAKSDTGTLIPPAN